MKKFDIPFWKDAPFVRIALPFIAGILCGFYVPLPVAIMFMVVVACILSLLIFSRIKVKWQYRFNDARGLLLNLFLIAIGAILAIEKNPFENKNILESYSLPEYIVSVKEPPLERKSSFKALSVLQQDLNANVIVYFKKDSSRAPPAYGARVAFSKKPERIKNFLPGSSFNYERYCALKNIHYQVFLSPSQYIVMAESDSNVLMSFLFQTQQWIVDALRKNIDGKRESGLAEALLIGYKNDLDKSLIQSYSNTGVVHVVAISGLHLGLIYALLNMMCKPFAGRGAGKVLKPVIVLAGLWLFSLLAGASPSVLRSAVMFSFVVVGQTVSKQASLTNNLCASAFLLLCYDPYWLWDLGFILSYSALLSITLFMKPINSLFVFENKMIDSLWKLNAVTLSAQVLTMPVLIYQFGQFPTLFMFTNMIAIPLSGIILVGEIILCAVVFLAPLAQFTGLVLKLLIRAMNNVVVYFDSFSFSTISGINVTLWQVVLIYFIIFFIAEKRKAWQ